ncbi:hypothetical protein ABH922_005232 [Rhodococcus sp. 27YEA15]|uniref:MFS transporter n=1 Tax=Rhodococcus sp. 27YEA15 TaxID=3156259 RepID=UPI003C7DB65E
MLCLHCSVRNEVLRWFHQTTKSLRYADYRRYFSLQALSLTGNWIQVVAANWLVLQITGSAVAVGFTSALEFLPCLLLGLHAGAVVDSLRVRVS